MYVVSRFIFPFLFVLIEVAVAKPGKIRDLKHYLKKLNASNGMSGLPRIRSCLIWISLMHSAGLWDLTSWQGSLWSFWFKTNITQWLIKLGEVRLPPHLFSLGTAKQLGKKEKFVMWICIFQLPFACPMVNFEPSSRSQSHSLDVNHWILTIST